LAIFIVLKNNLPYSKAQTTTFYYVAEPMAIQSVKTVTLIIVLNFFLHH